MKTDPCKDESLLSALIDGELSQELGAAVRRHMEDCPRCRQRFEDLKKTDATIRDMEAVEPSADFDRAFWRKVDNLEKLNKERSWPASLLAGWRPVLAAGAVAALTAVIIYIGHHGRLTSEEIFIAQNMELLQDYDLINNLDMLEQWDIIEAMEEPS